jgi:hypothetical protein
MESFAINHAQFLSYMKFLVPALVTLIIAYTTLKQWHRQFIGKRKIELAEKLIELITQINDEVDIVRSPFGRVDENYSFEEQQSQRFASMCNRKKQVFDELSILARQIKAYFGQEEKLVIEEYIKCLNELGSALNIMRNKSLSSALMKDNYSKYEYYQDICSGAGEDSVFKAKLNKATEKLEGILEIQIKEISKT